MLSREWRIAVRMVKERMANVLCSQYNIASLDTLAFDLCLTCGGGADPIENPTYGFCECDCNEIPLCIAVSGLAYFAQRTLSTSYAQRIYGLYCSCTVRTYPNGQCQRQGAHNLSHMDTMLRFMCAGASLDQQSIWTGDSWRDHPTQQHTFGTTALMHVVMESVEHMRCATTKRISADMLDI